MFCQKIQSKRRKKDLVRTNISRYNRFFFLLLYWQLYASIKIPLKSIYSGKTMCSGMDFQQCVAVSNSDRYVIYILERKSFKFTDILVLGFSRVEMIELLHFSL